MKIENRTLILASIILLLSAISAGQFMTLTAFTKAGERIAWILFGIAPIATLTGGVLKRKPLCLIGATLSLLLLMLCLGLHLAPAKEKQGWFYDTTKWWKIEQSRDQ